MALCDAHVPNLRGCKKQSCGRLVVLSRNHSERGIRRGSALCLWRQLVCPGRLTGSWSRFPFHSQLKEQPASCLSPTSFGDYQGRFLGWGLSSLQREEREMEPSKSIFLEEQEKEEKKLISQRGPDVRQGFEKALWQAEITRDASCLEAALSSFQCRSRSRNWPPKGPHVHHGGPPCEAHPGRTSGLAGNSKGASGGEGGARSLPASGAGSQGLRFAVVLGRCW